jgi:hypothetical protein
MTLQVHETGMGATIEVSGNRFFQSFRTYYQSDSVFVHDFDHFYQFKMAHLSIDGKGMIFVQHGYTTSTSLSSICFCCYSL